MIQGNKRPFMDPTFTISNQHLAEFLGLVPLTATKKKFVHSLPTSCNYVVGKSFLPCVTPRVKKISLLPNPTGLTFQEHLELRGTTIDCELGYNPPIHRLLQTMFLEAYGQPHSPLRNSQTSPFWFNARGDLVRAKPDKDIC